MENKEQITLTPEAAVAVQDLLKEQDLEGHSLRVYIAGVG